MANRRRRYENRKSEQTATSSSHPILLRTSASSDHGSGTAPNERIAQLAYVGAFLFDQLEIRNPNPNGIQMKNSGELHYLLFVSAHDLSARSPKQHRWFPGFPASAGKSRHSLGKPLSRVLQKKTN